MSICGGGRAWALGGGSVGSPMVCHPIAGKLSSNAQVSLAFYVTANFSTDYDVVDVLCPQQTMAIPSNSSPIFLASLIVWAPTIGSLVACGDQHVAATDAAKNDAAPFDAADAQVADGQPIDAGVCQANLVACALPLQPRLCEGAVPLTPEMPLLAQNSAAGGYGDCALNASGPGGPSLYYQVAVKPGSYTRIRAIPSGTELGKDALVRVFTSCTDVATTDSDRGGGASTPPGMAGVCVRNDTNTALSVIAAVSRYSGEASCDPLLFDIFVDYIATDNGCSITFP